MRRGSLLVLCVLALLGSVKVVWAHDRGDPWYYDMRGHWAKTYVRVLWEESVVDGYPGWSSSRAYYYPQRPATRAQYTLFLAHAFQLEKAPAQKPSFDDVGRTYEAYPDKPSWGYIEAAAAAGIVRGFPDGSFHPNEAIRRDHAIALLIRALDLGPFAQALSADDVELELSRFRDDDRVEPSVRKEVATAIKYGIVEGYPDHTLKPDSELLRSEAATLVYRSCVYRVSAQPIMLIRDEPGFDTVQFRPFILKNRSTSWYSISVSRTDGRQYWSYERRVRWGHPLHAVQWDGRTEGGRELRAGLYILGGAAEDRQDHHFEAAPRPLYIMDPRVSALATPQTVEPGTVLSLQAWTVGVPSSVVMTPPGESETVALSPSYRPEEPNPRLHQHWTGSYQVPADTPGGQFILRFTAEFEYAGLRVTRTTEVTVTVRETLRLTANVNPNPAAPTTVIEFLANTLPDADHVFVHLFDDTIPLLSVDQGQTWHEVRRYEGLMPGTYPAVFTALKDGKTKRTTVDLVVREFQLSDLLFRLTD